MNIANTFCARSRNKLMAWRYDYPQFISEETAGSVSFLDKEWVS